MEINVGDSVVVKSGILDPDFATDIVDGKSELRKLIMGEPF
jgi:hypothetical protein